MMCISKRDFRLLLRLARIYDKLAYDELTAGEKIELRIRRMKILRKLRGGE